MSISLPEMYDYPSLFPFYYLSILRNILLLVFSSVPLLFHFFKPWKEARKHRWITWDDYWRMYIDNPECCRRVASQRDRADVNNKWNRCNFWTCAMERCGFWRIDEKIWKDTRTIEKNIKVKSEEEK